MKDFSLKLELLNEFKKFGKRPPRMLDFWYYVGSYCYQKKELLFIPQIGWMYSWSDKTSVKAAEELYQLIKNNKDCKVKAPKWTIDTLTKGNQSTIDAETLSAVITPDGQLFLKDYSRKFITAVKYYCEFNDIQDAAYRVLNEPSNHREMFEIDNDKTYNPAWAEVEDALLYVEYEIFQSALDDAYKAWYEKKKTSPEYKKWQEHHKAQKLIKTTNKKMKLCMEAKSTIDLLQAYLNDIANNKATQEQNVKVYDQLSKLIRANKAAKNTLVNTKKKKKKK